jgi:thiol-disulfide isomerase/thioredoxin
MKKNRSSVTAVIVFVALMTCLSQVMGFAAGVDAAKLGSMDLETPEGADHRNYLGLTNEATFRLGQVKAPIVIVEVFSMYCPICQAEAPHVNELYRLIAADKAMNGKVRMIGIGTGNTPFEVEVFRKKYAVPFPLIPDDAFGMQKAFSEQIRTPTFLALKKDGDKGLKLVNVHVGAMAKPDAFLKKLAESWDQE